MFKSLVFVALLALGAPLCRAEVVDFHVCEDNACDISELRVEPCPQAVNHAACHIRRRKPASLAFDYTPKFDAEKLEAAVTWVKEEGSELPLVSLDTDACKYTKCPAKQGEKQTYFIELPIESKFPTNSYTIRWVLKDVASPKRCCFTLDIKVVR